MNSIFIRIFYMLVLSFGISAAAGADQPPQIPAAQAPILRCISKLMRVQPTVQSVYIYAVDGFRSAVEYTFRDPQGNTVTSDILIFGARNDGLFPYDASSPHSNAKKTMNEEMDFLGKISDDLASTCHVTPVLDDLLPPPPNWHQWRRVQ